jgi:hypothetical protein
MTIRVTAPNGATVEFPDGTDAETIQRVMLDNFGGGRGGAPAQTEPQVSSGEDIAKGFVGGLGRGAAGMAALPGTVETLGRMGVNWAGRRMGATSDTVSEEAFMPTYNDTKGALESVTGPLYEPKTKAGKYASTIGEFAPGVLFPGGVAQRVVGNVLAPAVASEAAGQATEGTRYEGLARAAGSVAGTFAPGIARSIVTPYPITSPAVANARNTLHGAGISVENGNLTAGQATGNRGLRILEESTAGTTFGGRRFEELTEAQQDAFTRGAMGMVGVNSNRANAPALQQMRDQIDNAYTAVGQAATIPAGNAQVAADVGTALQNYTTSVPRSFQTRQVRDIANEINTSLRPGGAGITGEQWLEWRRQLGSAARNSDDPAVQNALYNIQRALDDAAYQSLPQNLQQTMDVARRDYQRGMAVERAARGNTPEAAEGIITPDALNRAVNVTNPDQYLRERGALADMAEYSKAGKRLLSKLPNSGTPERARAMLALGAAGSVVGGTGDILFGGEGQRGAAIGAAAGMLGHALGRGASARAVMNPTVQRYLANQRWVNDPINRRRSLVATSPQTLPGEDEVEGRADGGRITGKHPMDSKFRRNFIKQEMAAGRKYSDVVREMHGRKKKADGGEVAPEMTRYERMRKAQQYRLRGMDPPAELMPTEADIAQGEEGSRRMADVGEMAAMTVAPVGRVLAPVARTVAANPIKTIAGLGAAATVGGAKATADLDPEFQELRRSLITETPELQRLRATADSAQKALMSAQGGNAVGSKQMGQKNQSIAAAKKAYDDAEAAYQAQIAKLETEASDRAKGIMAGRMQGRAEAKAFKDTQQKPFFEQYEQLRTDMPLLPSGSLLPVIAGAGGAALMGLKQIPASLFGRYKSSRYMSDGLAREATDVDAAQKAIDRAVTVARGQAPRHIDAGRLGTGAFIGATAGGLPVGMDAYSLPQMNPEKEAVRRYVDSMLEIDPIKQRERDRIEKLPDNNPAKEAAQNPLTYAKSMGFGAVEGLGGAKLMGIGVDTMRPNFSSIHDEAQAFYRRNPTKRPADYPDPYAPKTPTGGRGGQQGGGGGTQGGGGNNGQQNPPQPPLPPNNPNQNQPPAPVPYSPTSYRSEVEKAVRNVLDSGMMLTPANVMNAIDAEIAASNKPPLDRADLQNRVQNAIDWQANSRHTAIKPPVGGVGVMDKATQDEIVRRMLSDRKGLKVPRLADGGAVAACRSMKSDKDVIARAKRACGGRIKKADGGMVEHWSWTQPRDRNGRWA